MQFLEEFYARLYELAVVPVVVVESVEDAAPLAHALVAGGLTSAEVTLRTPCAVDAVRAMRAAEPGMCVGAGTVLTVEQAGEALSAGAEFIVSPGLDESLVAACLEREAPVLPGAVTSTEVMAARRLGLSVTKFFPAAHNGGLATVRSLAAPFAGHRFMPTGGVTAANLGEYLACPSVIACGGTWMVKTGLIAEGRFDEVGRLAAEAMRVSREARTGFHR